MVSKPTSIFNILLLTVIVVFSSSETEAVRGTRLDYSRQCEGIKIDICKGIGYNVTAMPNFAGHEMQQDAELQIQSFQPLIQYGCSSQLRFFLCSAYVPMCTEKVPDNIGPCRPLCETVKQRCHPVLLEFGYAWPPSLDCSKFPPENNYNHMCMEGPGEDPSATPPSVIETSSSRIRPIDVPSRPKSTTSTPQSSSLCESLKHSSQFYFVNRTEQCSQKCEADILFSKENKDFAETWLLIWVITCLFATTITIITFASGSSTFRYPERIIVFMSITYFMYSLGYMIRLVFGREEVSCHLDSQHNVSLLITEGPDNFKCTIVFVLLYYFGMASTIWWVNFTISWFLTSGLNWSPEAVERKSTFFHLTSWLIPAFKTIAILIMRAVDADELTGTCFIGNHSRGTLLAFIILPGSLYLLIGLLFLCALFHCLYFSTRFQDKACSTLRKRHQPTMSRSQQLHPQTLVHVKAPSLTSCCQPKDKQDLMNIRIAFYAIFYLVITACLLGGNFYEYFHRDVWYQNGSSEMPNVEFFTIKIFMSLVIGIKAGFWIWSSKSSLRIWSQTYSRFSGSTLKKKPQSPSYLLTLPPMSSSSQVSSSVSCHMPMYFPPPPPPSSTSSSSGKSSMTVYPPPEIFAGSSSLRSSHHLNFHQQQPHFATLDKSRDRDRKGGETRV